MIILKTFSKIPYLKAPDYKEFLKQNPKAKPVDKYVKLFPKILQLAQKPKYREFNLLYSPVSEPDIVWNDWIDTEKDLYMREYYPVLSWVNSNYHSDLYFHIPTGTWIEFDGDTGPKEYSIKFKTPGDWISYNLYLQYRLEEEYYEDNDESGVIKELEEYFSEFCKIVGLNWNLIKKDESKIIPPGAYVPDKPVSPSNKPKYNGKLSENLKWGSAAGGLAGYLGGGLVAKARALKNGDPRIANTILGGLAAGTLAGAGYGAYRHYKNKRKSEKQ